MELVDFIAGSYDRILILWFKGFENIKLSSFLNMDFKGILMNLFFHFYYSSLLIN